MATLTPSRMMRFVGVIASLPTLFVAPSTPPEALALVQEILEEYYFDGIDNIVSAELSQDGDIVGEFTDRVGARELKRYQYRIGDDVVEYTLLNPKDTAKFSAIYKNPMFGPGSRKGKKKTCTKGTPCGDSCQQAGRKCSKKPGSAVKAKIAEAKEKLSAKPAKTGRKAAPIEAKSGVIASVSSSLRQPKEGQKFKNGKEVFVRENGRTIEFYTPDSEEQYNNLFDSWLGNTTASQAEYGYSARYVAGAAALDPNRALSLPSHGDAGNTIKPEEAKKVFSSLINQAGTDGEPVVMQIKGKEDREIALALGLSPAKYTSKYSTNENALDLIKLKLPGIIDTGRNPSAVAKNAEIWIGKKQGDKVVPFTDEEVKVRRKISLERGEQISALQEHNEWVHVFGDPPSVARQNAYNRKESKRLESVETLEDSLLGRNPGNTGDYSSYQKKAEKWATKTFGDVSAGANGFTLAQTKAHDVAHPITHELLNTDSAGIHQRLGKLKQADGKPSLLAEEAVVNVVEHLSRGDTIEGSILNGLRLARVLSRTGTDEERAYVRSRQFKKELVKMGHELYRHNNFSPLIKHVRTSNRESGTVLTGGNDFTNSASGG